MQGFRGSAAQIGHAKSSEWSTFVIWITFLKVSLWMMKPFLRRKCDADHCCSARIDAFGLKIFEAFFVAPRSCSDPRRGLARFVIQESVNSQAMENSACPQTRGAFVFCRCVFAI
jgi:hypothetical protein